MSITTSHSNSSRNRLIGPFRRVVVSGPRADITVSWGNAPSWDVAAEATRDRLVPSCRLHHRPAFLICTATRAVESTNEHASHRQNITLPYRCSPGLERRRGCGHARARWLAPARGEWLVASPTASSQGCLGPSPYNLERLQDSGRETTMRLEGPGASKAYLIVLGYR